MSRYLFEKNEFIAKIAKMKKLHEENKNQSCCLFVPSEDKSVDFYSKSSVFFIWLLGYDAPQSVIVYSFEKSVLHFFGDTKKYGYLSEITSGSGINIKIDSLKNLEKALEHEEFGKHREALFLEEKNMGEFSKNVMEKVSSHYSLSEAGTFLSELMASKFENEIENIEKASELCCAIYKHFLVPKIETVVDEDIKISHKELSEQTAEITSTPQKVEINLDEKYLENCYEPIIQSGGEYSLKLSATSNSKKLNCAKSAPALVSLGVAYKSYCCSMVRTLLFNPTEEQKRIYEALVSALEAIKENLIDGVFLKDVHSKALEVIHKISPENENSFVKSVGFATGIQFRDSFYSITNTNNKKVHSGMVFVIRVGFENLIDTLQETPYSMQIVETVIITPNGCKTATKAPYNLGAISYSIDDNKDEKNVDNKSNSDDNKEEEEEENFKLPMKRKTRHTGKMVSLNDDDKIREKHRKLLSRKIDLALRSEEKKTNTKQPEKTPELISYAEAKLIPATSSPFKIFFDIESESLLLPVSGTFVPIHLSRLKNIQMSRSENICLLQISFDVVNAIKRSDKTRGNCFIREIIFRSRNSANFTKVINSVREIKKKNLAGRKSSEALKMSSVQNKSIILSDDKINVPRIRHLKVLPMLAGKKSSIGVLEAHKNGFLFTMSLSNSKPVRLPILYENIKHAFFQRAKNSVSVLLHFTLRNPVKLSRYSKEVQFYIEVIENSQNLDKNMRSDLDSIREEQREHAYKKKLNKLFKNFVVASTKVVRTEGGFPNFKFEIPDENSKFIGVPDRTTVSIYPTVSCFVSLEEHPPFVLPLEDVEVAHFERVQYQLKHFDMVFVLKGLKEFRKIDAIPKEHLQSIRKYLNDADIIYYTGSVNLDWSKVLKEINSDLNEFWKSGGWAFLDPKSKGDGESSQNSGDSSSADDFTMDEKSEESYSEKEEEEKNDMEEEEEDVSENEEEEESYDAEDDLK